MHNSTVFIILLKLLYILGYAIDPTVVDSKGDTIVSRIPDVSLAAAVEPGEKAATVFEKTVKRPADKRKRNKNNDAGDIEGFTGPWAAFVDEKRDIKPSDVRNIMSF